MAENTYVNKVIYNGSTLIDLTGDTVSADSLINGYTAHDRSGASISGSVVIPTKVSDLQNDVGYTTNTGTVTNVSTGAGLTGGDVTTTGTIKVDLTSETKLSNAAADGTETAGRVYPVRLDTNGKLAVNVPWTDTQTITGVKGDAEQNYRTGDVSLTAANVGAKSIQTAVSDPIASGASLTFIDSISQNTQGVITATKKTVDIATLSEFKTYLGIS